MFGHIPELLIILVIGLIVFGPEKLPEVAAQAGKMVREVRSVMDAALNPHDTEVPEDFSSYYFDALNHSGETVPEQEEEPFEFEMDSDGFTWPEEGTEETALPGAEEAKEA